MHIHSVLCLLLLPFFTPAQSVKYSPKNIDNTVFDFVKVAGQDEDGFYLLQSNISFDTDKDRVGFRSRKYKVTYYDFDLNEKWSRTFAKKDDDIPVESIAFGNGELILSYTELNADKDIVAVFALTLNNKNQLSEKKKIADVSFTNLSELDKIKIAVSHNRSGYVFIQNEIKKDDTQCLHIVTTTPALLPVSQNKIDISYPEKSFYFESWTLSDSGDFALLGSHYTKEKFTNKKKWIGYKLFVMKNGYKNAVEYALNSNELFLEGTLMTYDYAKNDIVVAGMYSERPPGSSGIFLTKLSLSGNNAPVIKKQSVSEGEKAKLQSTQSTEMNPYQLLNYTIEKIILRSDGGAVMIAEASYTSEFSYYDYFSQTYVRRVEYHFENAVTFSMNTDGSTSWNAVLRKSQISTDDYGIYSSFALVVNEDHINFIYNDELDKTNALKLFAVSKDGKTEERFINKPEDRTLIIPGSGKQISENEIVLPCWQRKNLTLIKITL